MSNKKTYSYKLCVVGDAASGKSSLIRRYASKTFDESYLPTIGADFTIKQIEYPAEDGTIAVVTLSIWDMGGQERFKNIREHYFLGANAAFVLFDLTRKQTFHNLEKWLGDIDRFCGHIPIIVIANKIDLPNIEVTQEEIGQFISQKNLKVFRTSAKTGENVEKIFDVIAKTCLTFYDTTN
ncbi:MAG: Rab family GTPase [Candidatus Helarchaeota archaeon]